MSVFLQAAARQDVLLSEERSARQAAVTEAAGLKGQLQALKQQHRQHQLEGARHAEATRTHAAQVCLNPST